MFSQNPCFAFIAFDITSKPKNLQNAYYKLNITATDAAKTLNIFVDELTEYMDKKCKKLKSYIIYYDVSNNKSSGCENVDVLMNKVDIVSSRSFPTIEEKKIDLKKVLSVSNYSKGAGALFH